MANDTVWRMDSRSAVKKLNKLQSNGYPRTVRDSLNGMAIGAARYGKSKTLPKHFEIRNKWTRGSIVPAPNKPFGLIPKSKTDINRMFSKMGSRSEYLADQEEGFRKRQPNIPLSKTSRRGGSFKGTVSAPKRLNKITKDIKTYRDVKSKARTRKGKTFAMLSIMQRRGYRGFYWLDVPGTFQRGIFKTKSNRKLSGSKPFNRMLRLRGQEKGSKSYKRRPWMTDITRKFQQPKTYDFYFKQAVKKRIDPIFRGK
jgi:hypothetical protein